MTDLKIIARFPAQKSSLLLILHELQNANSENYLSHEDLIAVADYLNVPLSSVYGVATYYSMYSIQPRGRHLIRVCNSPVCDMVGSADLTNRLKSLLGVGIGETTPDGSFTLEESACLGRCDSAPSVMIDDEYYGALDDDALAAIIDRYRNAD